ncbi:MAG TPA: DUF2207 domain-containing protein [bacterium]|jgi:uncharacterized membrane protein|nr:DUF2207 domain-containing protein [bacterium]HOG38480.1 DUF2207 domain-containing protein [bacterium]HQI03537.1 DUF2207 domain-containing protein [bacterium]
MFKKIIFPIICLIFLLPIFVSARENVNYWYIKDFQTEIVLNTDSSVLITEFITADCGNANNKHGIFRVMGTQINTGKKIIQMPVELISITDFNGKPYKYTTVKDKSKHTITWKIGDPNITVRGVNYYKIQYKVQNTIYNQLDFDEFYFNILAHFWDLEIDNFNGKIFLPKEINKDNVTVYYYTGPQGSKSNNLANYNWLDNNTLIFNSTKTIPVNNGITVSLAFPKNIFLPYAGGTLEEDNSLESANIRPIKFLSKNNLKIAFALNLIIPIIAFIFCFIIWKKYGDDPRDTRTIIPEYDIPDNLDPLLLGVLWKNGVLKNNFITAAIINFAVKKILTIEEVEKKFLFKSRDYILRKLDNKKAEESLSDTERLLLVKLFDYKKSVKLSTLKDKDKDKFYRGIKLLKKNVKDKLNDLGYTDKTGFKWQIIFNIIGIFCIFISMFTLPFTFPFVFFGLLVSGVIFFIFSFFMPKTTEKGREVLHKIKGLKLYMKVAEKDRQRFYEKVNIFEKLLPYAIVFGMAKLWINKMKIIYSEEQFNSIMPTWYIGSAISSDMNSFLSSFNSFTNSLNSVVSSVSSASHNSSGFGGGGFSGGGGGGGGGGGW